MHVMALIFLTKLKLLPLKVTAFFNSVP